MYYLQIFCKPVLSFTLALVAVSSLPAWADHSMPLLTMPPVLAAHANGQPAPSWWRPGPGTSWQWQLSGTIDTTVDASMYDIDLFDTPQSVIDELHNKGRIVICYFSAGSYEDWRPDKDRYPASVLGRDLDGWPGEKWVDIRRIDILGPILADRLDLARAKQCDGVEPDNVDGYTNNSGFPLSAADQLVCQFPGLFLFDGTFERFV